jgi:hypothetical protein
MNQAVYQLPALACTKSRTKALTITITIQGTMDECENEINKI